VYKYCRTECDDYGNLIWQTSAISSAALGHTRAVLRSCLRNQSDDFVCDSQFLAQAAYFNFKISDAPVPCVISKGFEHKSAAQYEIWPADTLYNAAIQSAKIQARKLQYFQSIIIVNITNQYQAK
jgi:hypothetical protein